MVERAAVKCALGAVAFGVIGASAVEARAADVEIDSTSAFQAYEVASPWGTYDLERRRYLQMLGFSVRHLQGDFVPGKDDYNARVMVRADMDFGLEAGETDFTRSAGQRYVPGLGLAKIDVMMAYLEGRNLADGWLSFRVGRQYTIDTLGFWNFDGGLLRLHTPAFFDVEVFGGLEQRGGLPLSTSRFESQGVWRGSHADFTEDGIDGPKRTDFPSFQESGIAPAFGAAIESAGPNWIHGRFSYRRVYNTGSTITRQFPDQGGGYRTADGLRLSNERLGYSLSINKSDLGGLKGGFSYDLYNQLFPTAFGALEAYLGPYVTIGLDADHYHPTFDADSIFNWFTHNPTTTALARVELRPVKRIEITAQGGARLWSTEGDPEAYGDLQCQALKPEFPGETKPNLVKNCLENGATTKYGQLVKLERSETNRPTTYFVDGLGFLTGRFRDTLGSFELRGMAQFGEQGHRAGGDVAGEKLLDGGRYSLGARASLYGFGAPGWDPITRTTNVEDSNTWSFGYVLGAGYKPLDLARIQAEWEHDMNDIVGQRFRVMARLDVEWAR